MSHPPINLIDAVEIGLRAKHEGRQTGIREVNFKIDSLPWDGTKIHASDLGSVFSDERPPGKEVGCDRQIWLRLRGAATQEVGIGKLLMFDNAHRLHEMVAAYLAAGLPAQGWHVVKVEEVIEAEGDGRLDVLAAHFPEPIMGGVGAIYQLSPGAQWQGWSTDPTTARVVYADSVCVIDIKTVRGAAFAHLAEPKPQHMHQVQGYVRAEKADFGAVLYVDREGQNGFKQFLLCRDDAEVERRWRRLQEIQAMEREPPVLLPVLRVKENKGPDAIYVDEPWPCQYCGFRDVSCPGALPPSLRERGVVGKLAKDGKTLVEADTYWRPILQVMIETNSLKRGGQ